MYYYLLSIALRTHIIIVNVVLPHLFGRGTFWQEAVLPKTQTSCRIPLIIRIPPIIIFLSIPIEEAISLKATWKMQARIEIESETKHFTVIIKLCGMSHSHLYF